MAHSFMTKQITSESLVYAFFSMHAAIVHITKQNLTQENVKENMLLWKDKKKCFKFCSLGKQHNRINHHVILLHIIQAS